MSEPTDSPKALDLYGQGLSGVTVSAMSLAERRDVRARVIAQKMSGASWHDLELAWPNIPLRTMRAWHRESNWEQADNSPEYVEEIRARQATELRAMIGGTLARIHALDDAAPDYDDDGRPRSTTDEYAKLIATLDKLQAREAKLLGADRAVKVELGGKLTLDSTPELEALVAELAGGGMLLSKAGEIVDGEVVES